ncbi:MAG: zinc ribbon domain-containing protein [Oscillospiraceae bacterium]|nr:zinc ribbon domain-containing protein [Oscillospiraceae bacterium]
MSDIIKKITDTITETGKNVGEKTKQVGNAAKLNAKIISSERSISENYTIIGKYYYDMYKENPDADIAEAVNSVTASLETIADLKGQILAIKGLVKCTKCEASCPIEDTFCGKCGAELEKPEPVVEEDAAEEAEENADIEIVVADSDEASEETTEE